MQRIFHGPVTNLVIWYGYTCLPTCNEKGDDVKAYCLDTLIHFHMTI